MCVHFLILVPGFVIQITYAPRANTSHICTHVTSQCMCVFRECRMFQPS